MRYLSLFLVILVFSVDALSATEETLFSSEEILKVKLEYPYKIVNKEKKNDERNWHKAEIEISSKDEKILNYSIKVKTRGKFRRLNCINPPIALKIDKDNRDNYLKNQKQLKLVVPCKNTTRSSQQVILEYLSYKAYELISDNSFKTRLLDLKISDQKSEKIRKQFYAFLIEDNDSVAKRIEHKKLKVQKISWKDLSNQDTNTLQLFQLMIGNTDFSTIRGPEGSMCCHNIELFVDNTETIYPVPYDFDMSGLVDAKYATPSDLLPIKNVRKRYYMGRCRGEETLNKSINKILSHKEEILNLFANNELLNADRKRWALNYLSDYFAILENKEKTNKYIIKRCR